MEEKRFHMLIKVSLGIDEIIYNFKKICILELERVGCILHRFYVAGE